MSCNVKAQRVIFGEWYTANVRIGDVIEDVIVTGLHAKPDDYALDLFGWRDALAAAIYQHFLECSDHLLPDVTVKA